MPSFFVSCISANIKSRKNTRLFISLSKDPSHWNPSNFKNTGELKITSFNLLAPCYKRIEGRFGEFGLIREAMDQELWQKRLENASIFFKDNLLTTSDIVAFQEFWLEDYYRSRFEEIAADKDYEMLLLKRHPKRKADALVLAVNSNMLVVKDYIKVELCTVSDRIAQIVWLYHKKSNKNIIIGNTHLSVIYRNFIF